MDIDRLFTSGGWIRMRGNWVNSLFESKMMWTSVVQLIRQIWFDMYSQREYYNHDITIWFDILHVVRYCNDITYKNHINSSIVFLRKAILIQLGPGNCPIINFNPRICGKKVAIYKYSTVDPQKTSRSHMILTNTKLLKAGDLSITCDWFLFQYPWTPKPWKMKVLHPQHMGYNP